jgi:hypothetical protein
MITEYLQLGLLVVLIVGNYIIYKVQTKRIEALEKTSKKLNELISGQSKIISDFEKYKSLFDIEDFEKRLNLKLENQSMELNKQFNLRSRQIIEETLKVTSKKLQETEGTIIKGWEEFSQIVISISLNQFPKPEDKRKRDEFIQKHYPINAEYLIGFIDAHLNGELDQD